MFIQREGAIDPVWPGVVPTGENNVADISIKHLQPRSTRSAEGSSAGKLPPCSDTSRGDDHRGPWNDPRWSGGERAVPRTLCLSLQAAVTRQVIGADARRDHQPPLIWV